MCLSSLGRDRVPPHPVWRAQQVLDRLGGAGLVRLDRAEQGKEFVQLDLRDAHIVQEIPGKGRGVRERCT